jgi:hypothetical protein
LNILKQLFSKSTGYWLHKINNLPVGADLFIDIEHKIKYPSLDIMFDVGANTGQTWNWVRHHRPHAKIYSFEPVQSTFAQLQKRTAGDTNCVTENIARAKNPGKKLSVCLMRI